MDLGRDAPLLILLVLSLFIAAFVAAAEAALVRITRIRAATLAADGSKRGERLHRIAEDLPRVLSAVLLAALLAQITAATVTGILADRWFGNPGVTIGSIVLTIVLFVYGEAIPKTYAVHHTDRVALLVALPVGLIARALRPVVSALAWLADIQMPGEGVTTSPTVTEDELRRLAFHAASEGEITDEDLVLIERALRFGDRRVDDIMVPRTDIVAVDGSTSVADALEVALIAGHRRLPVYHDTIDNISGVVRLRVLVAQRSANSQRLVDELAQPPLVVPTSRSLFEVLGDMQTHRSHLAVIVDEFGGTAGIVTIEDVAEELMGSMSDDTTDPIVTLGDGRVLLSGALPVEDLEAVLGEPPPEGEWNTVAGLMMGVAGRLLEVGDEVTVGARTLRVSRARGRRVLQVEVDSPAN